MNKLFFVFLAVISSFAFAGENEMFFTTFAECNSAKEVKYYVPALKRPAPSTWKREALDSDTCVQMDTVQGKFFVRLAKGTELAQNPKTGAWHHVLCTNWTNWKQPERVVVVDKTTTCDDCNKAVEHTTTVVEKVVVQCANGAVISFNGPEKKDPKAVCPEIKVETSVSSETKVNTNTKTQATCQDGDCVKRPTDAEREALCRAKDGKAQCRFRVSYEGLRQPKAGECGLQNKQENTLALIHGSKDHAECCVRKDALIEVLKKLDESKKS